ncbi:MAG: hypothetical protein M1835_002662 [Candelina submexicana]|nr:MAG: hypothetical protein M1835_002662 [Candelina submexicana]
MLAACPRSSLFDYTPQRSSPFLMRDAHVYPHLSPYNKSKSAFPASEALTPFSQRPIRSNPLMAQNKEKGDRQTRQRDLFLKRVRQDGEERKWQSRSEELLRLDFVSMEKRWRADLARTAPDFTDEPDEETNDTMTSSESEYSKAHSSALQFLLTSAGDDCIVEDVLQHEHRELDELLSMMETSRQAEDAPSSTYPLDYEADNSSTVYEGEDDDYESLFRDVIRQGLDKGQHLREPLLPVWGEQRHEHDMDLSGG